LDIAALQALVAIAETGSFSRAAEQLFMTQPAISKRLAALESELGVQLIDRLGRRCQLTEAGDSLLISARRILADIATSREEVRSMSAAVGGKLRLATSHHIGIHRLPPVLKRYTQAHPEVDLDLMFMDSERACDLIAEGSLELAIVTLPRQELPRLKTQLVWPDPLVIACAADHELAQQRNIKPKALNAHAAVLPARGTVTRTILLEALAPHDVTINTSLETNYLETIKMMVSVGLGWSALPENMLDDTLTSVQVMGVTMQRELGYVSLQGRTLSRAASTLIDMLPNQTPFVS